MMNPYFETKLGKLYNCDCLDFMPTFPDKSIDMILCDLPYGTTACKWDTIIPFEPLWEQYKRIIKSNGAIVLFGSEPFSSYLRLSNIKNYKYDWIWEKDKPTNFALANKQPMRYTENISVFYTLQPTYNKILEKRETGISVYEGIEDDGKYSVIMPPLTYSCCVSLSGVLDRQAYLVDGVVIGSGSDGECLLKDCKIIKAINVSTNYLGGGE